MKLINPSFEIYEQGPGIKGIYEAIEKAGRTCYKSQRKEGTTAKDFVDKMIASQHFAMLEHGTVYLYLSKEAAIREPILLYFLEDNKYTVVKRLLGGYYITTNYRVIMEGPKLVQRKYKSYAVSPTEFHEKRVTVRFTADIHFYKDTTRHRVFSWAIESTRFCNYLKEKFGMSVSFMRPTWIKEEDIPELEEDCRIMESIYFKWINKGYQAQHAAYFLPQGTKAEVIMTGFASDYNHFFDLRAKGTTGKPHPDVQALVEPLMQEFINRHIIEK